MNATSYLEQMRADPALAAAFRDRLAPKLFAVISAELGASMRCGHVSDEDAEGRVWSSPLEFDDGSPLGDWTGVIDVQFNPPGKGPTPPADFAAACSR